MSRISIARRNLLHDRARTAVALAGLGFSLVVVFLQLGFLQAMLSTATTVLDKLDHDIMIVSKNYHYVADAGRFPLARLVRAAAVPGVARVVPLYVRTGAWRSQAPPVAGRAGAEPWRQQSILVLGLAPESRSPSGLPFRPVPGFDPGEIAGQLDRLAVPRALLIDRRSRDEFGPQGAGTSVELNGEDFEIAGQCDLGTGFAATGAALLESHNFARAFGGAALEAPSLGLVAVAAGEDVAAVADRLEAALPIFRDDPRGGPPLQAGDVRVLLRGTLRGLEQGYWITEKAIGSIFVMGVVISVLVGFVVVYQVLSSDIADHMAEFATLKALGATDLRIAGVVIEQALLLGVIGYGLALVVSAGLYVLVESSTRLPMTLGVWWILAIPMALAVAITAGSALLSVRKVYQADPAELFR